MVMEESKNVTFICCYMLILFGQSVTPLFQISFFWKSKLHCPVFYTDMQEQICILLLLVFFLINIIIIMLDPSSQLGGFYFVPS